MNSVAPSFLAIQLIIALEEKMSQEPTKLEKLDRLQNLIIDLIKLYFEMEDEKLSQDDSVEEDRLNAVQIYVLRHIAPVDGFRYFSGYRFGYFSEEQQSGLNFPALYKGGSTNYCVVGPGSSEEEFSDPTEAFVAFMKLTDASRNPPQPKLANT